jgi:membrane protein
MGYLKRNCRHILKILKDTTRSFQRHEPIVYSAAIAFFTIFSLPAILIVLTFVGSMFFAEEAVRTGIERQLEELISPEVAEQVGKILRNITEMPAGFWGVLIGVAVVVQSATIIFYMMQKALNSVWEVRVKRHVSVFRLLKHRLITLAMVAGLGLLLLCSLMLDALILLFREQLNTMLEEYVTSAIRLIQAGFSLLVVLVFFTAIHKALPDANVSWRDALAGGVITSILFLIGKQLINYILASIRVVGVYAAAGSFVVVLLWVFYSSVILMLGAELTKAYAIHHGRGVVPSKIAEKYSKANEDER